MYYFRCIRDVWYTSCVTLIDLTALFVEFWKMFRLARTH